MAYLLCIDTAVYTCSVALFKDNQLLDYTLEEDKNKSSEILNTFIESVCSNTGISLKELDAVGIISGPGSYTGLRIASSTAKGLCYGLEIPLIAISTFEAMRASISKNEKHEQYILAIDARREEIFGAIQNEKGEDVIEPNTYILSQDSPFIKSILPHRKNIVVGDGADKIMKYLSSEHSNTILSQHTFNASQLGEVIFNKFLGNNFEEIAYFEPNYIKPAFTTIANKK